MKEKAKTKHQLLLEMEELRTKMDFTRQRLQEAKELLQAEIAGRKRLEEVFAEAQKYTESIVETIREPLIVLTPDLRVIGANHSFYETFQVTPEETEGQFVYSIGRRAWDIPSLRQLLEEIIPQNAHFPGFKVEHEFPVIGRRTMILNARRIYQEGKSTDRILLAIEDITEQKESEEALKVSETRYRRLFETAQDGILILDSETGRIADVNPFLIEMLGYTHEELLGKQLWEIGPFKNVKAAKAAFAELQSKGYVRHDDLPLETKDGRPIAVEFVSNVYLVNHHKVIQCNIRNITERKRIAEALQQAYSELEQRVEERTVELRTALSEIKTLKDQLEAENIYFRQEIKSKHQLDHILGQSDGLKYILYRAEQVAPTNTTVLILGETGTGKELIAAAIHNLSPRKDRPLITVNCAALPGNLIESELFGREKGAFTGSDGSRSPMVPPFVSTRSGNCRWRCRPSCCG
jgi:PAS domain S-box-containing protein